MVKGLSEIYSTDDDFKNYVDKYCQQHKLTVEQALTLKMVAEYAEYLKERKENQDDRERVSDTSNED